MATSTSPSQPSGAPRRSRRCTTPGSSGFCPRRGPTTNEKLGRPTMSSPTCSPCRDYAPEWVSETASRPAFRLDSVGGASRRRRRSPLARIEPPGRPSTWPCRRRALSSAVSRSPTGCAGHQVTMRPRPCTADTASSTTRRSPPTTWRRPPADVSPCSTSTTTTATAPSRSSTTATTSPSCRCTGTHDAPTRTTPASPMRPARAAAGGRPRTSHWRPGRTTTRISQCWRRHSMPWTTSTRRSSSCRSVSTRSAATRSAIWR